MLVPSLWVMLITIGAPIRGEPENEALGDALGEEEGDRLGSLGRVGRECAAEGDGADENKWGDKPAGEAWAALCADEGESNERVEMEVDASGDVGEVEEDEGGW